MASRVPKSAGTEGSTTFTPDSYFAAWSKEEITPPYDNDFRKFILRTFGLSLRNEEYVYRAIAEVTLLQVQTYLEFGAKGGLHSWYLDDEGKARENPSAADVAAYTHVFRPTTSTAKALTTLSSNAKKGSLRAEIGSHLREHYQPRSPSGTIDLGKNIGVQIGRRKDFVNPYFDVWAWANQKLEWGGPEATTHRIKISHALLPVLYHHFGCVCPSYDALQIIRQLSNGRRVLDVGSGNGYWTYMLRRMEKFKKKEIEVLAIDNGISEWRTMWIGDTVEADAIKWLEKNGGGIDEALLMVYPQVGGEFTSKVIKAYKGSTIFAASTQNANGFTAFSDETIDKWMEREMPEWEKQLQIPLPSFAGKDEALFVFERKS
ncbi:hypothetical protein K431DRAFT_283449 [Polychaeton citri CBS 116435]|uniref:S-adenosyl-L-methionine-dependent methyltransferase n=1 Tax=Polychaeton citri CBS 116435 TaxID=1314669 RepID=A0A9P4Q985_9PEZI|nr:hypothetical protein K431DRAFT_283449 [Polychaeton citri CBS 116435]